MRAKPSVMQMNRQHGSKKARPRNGLQTQGGGGQTGPAATGTTGIISAGGEVNPPRFLVTFDSVSYSAKPKGHEDAITRRMQAAGPTECDAATFCRCIGQGKTWVGGTYETKPNGWGKFLQQQIFAVDIDNDATVLGPDGKPLKDKNKKTVKRRLRPDEPGYLDPWGALDRCEELNLWPMCLYFTFHCRAEPLWWRYRLVFDLGKPCDEPTAQAVIKKLLQCFPEADKSCSRPNRLFFGTCWQVLELWRWPR